MTGISDVIAAGGLLRDALFAQSDLPGADSDEFRSMHLQVDSTLKKMLSSGDSDGSSAFAQVNAATQAVNAYQPANMDQIRQSVNSALEAMRVMIRPSAQFTEMFRGALKVRGFAAPTPPVVAAAGAPDGAPTPAPPPSPPLADQPEQYYKSLIKLFPTEAATAYPLISGIAGSDSKLRIGLIIVLLAFVVLIRYLATQSLTDRKPDFAAILTAAVSFLLFALSLGGFGSLGLGERTPLVASFLTILWVALVPYLVRQKATPEA